MVLEVPAGEPRAVQPTLPLEWAVALGVLLPPGHVLLHEAGDEGPAAGSECLGDQPQVGGRVLIVHVREHRVGVEDVDAAGLGRQGAFRRAVRVVALIAHVDAGEAEAGRCQVLARPVDEFRLDIDTVVVGDPAEVLPNPDRKAPRTASPVEQPRVLGQVGVLLEALDIADGRLDEGRIVLEVLSAHPVLTRRQHVTPGLLRPEHVVQPMAPLGLGVTLRRQALLEQSAHPAVGQRPSVRLAGGAVLK